MLLVVVPKSAGLHAQIAIAECLVDAGYDVCLLMLFAKSSVTVDVNSILESRSWRLVFIDDLKAIDVKHNKNFSNRFVNKVSKAFPGRRAESFKNLAFSYKIELNQVISILKDIKPKSLLVSSDGIASNMFLNSVAQSLNIPIICCPYGFCGEIDLHNDLLKKIESGRSIDTSMHGGKIVKKLFPKWVKTVNKIDYLMLKPDVILAREAAGVSLMQPWRVYGSDADIMCVPSHQYKEHLINEGFCPKKIEVIGSINGDIVWSKVQQDAVVRESFRKPKKIQKGVVRVLLSMPPNYHATRGQYTCFPNSYNDLVEGVVCVLTNIPNIELTVSVHPSAVTEDLVCFEALNIKVVKGGVVELIPQCDVYVTDYSSTIRWAIACGKPVINYDFYNFNLGVYSEASGVITVRKHLEYEKTVLKLTNEENFFNEIAGKQIAVADHWGVIDGLFIPNLIAVIERCSVPNKMLFHRVVSLLSHKSLISFRKKLWLKYQLVFGNFD